MPRRAEAPARVRGRGIELARPDAQVTPGPKGGGHPTAHCASPARVPGAAALSRTGDVRPRDVHRARRGGRHGPARAGGRRCRPGSTRPRPAWTRACGGATTSGSIPTSPRPTAAWSRYATPGRGGETVVRLLVERDGHRILRALDERCPERTVDAGNETDIRGVVVLVETRSEQHRRRRALRIGPARPRRGLPGIDPLTATATVRGAGSDRWPRNQAARYSDQDSISARRFSKRSLRA